MSRQTYPVPYTGVEVTVFSTGSIIPEQAVIEEAQMITSLFSTAESAPSANAGDYWTSFVPGEILWLSHMHILWAPFAVLKSWEFVCRH